MEEWYNNITLSSNTNRLTMNERATQYTDAINAVGSAMGSVGPIASQSSKTLKEAMDELQKHYASSALYHLEHWLTPEQLIALYNAASRQLEMDGDENLKPFLDAFTPAKLEEILRKSL